MRGVDNHVNGGGHVMNLPVSQDQEDVVEGTLQVVLHTLSHLIQDVGEVGRPAQRDVCQVLSVDLRDAYGAVHLWIRIVAVQREAMLRLIAAEVARDATETVDREASIVIVDFKDGADCRDRLLILIEVAEEMQ